VPLGDADAFVRAAAALAQGPDRVRRMQGSVSASVDHLGWDRVVDRFEGLLFGVGRASRNSGPARAGERSYR
jgi:hypothetical protein